LNHPNERRPYALKEGQIFGLRNALAARGLTRTSRAHVHGDAARMRTCPSNYATINRGLRATFFASVHAVPSLISCSIDNRLQRIKELPTPFWRERAHRVADHPLNAIKALLKVMLLTAAKHDQSSVTVSAPAANCG
jgi:hypothetical protein